MPILALGQKCPKATRNKYYQKEIYIAYAIISKHFLEMLESSKKHFILKEMFLSKCFFFSFPNYHVTYIHDTLFFFLIILGTFSLCRLLVLAIICFLLFTIDFCKIKRWTVKGKKKKKKNNLMMIKFTIN